ncbi:sugar-binding transcriptional regulator [Pelagibius sp. 7325]|uniref:sugar-binding transcriptional regulator n=1 Tax=Pelagibius sp. 7325 TaxID=3131994 RepID=UPI0030EB462E
MKKRRDDGDGRLDDAARAGWLYYVAGNTQDEIAAKLGISRQSAQRLVSLAVSEGLVKVRLDHPLANCMELAQRLRARFGLALCEVVPTDPDSESTTLGVADAAAAEMERRLKSSEMKVMAIGTGRTLKAAGELLPRIEAPDKKIVSLTGNFTPDGAAAFYSVIFTLAEGVNARHYPLPMPVIAASPQERDLLHQQIIVRTTLELAAQADVTFLGIGELSPRAPLQEDGFITKEELAALKQAGAVAEILGWAFDAEGCLIPGLTNARVASAPLPSPERSLVIAVAKGAAKLAGIRVAVGRPLVNGLITDEWTAGQLLGK